MYTLWREGGLRVESCVLAEQKGHEASRHQQEQPTWCGHLRSVQHTLTASLPLGVLDKEHRTSRATRSLLVCHCFPSFIFQTLLALEPVSLGVAG